MERVIAEGSTVVMKVGFTAGLMFTGAVPKQGCPWVPMGALKALHMDIDQKYTNFVGLKRKHSAINLGCKWQSGICYAIPALLDHDLRETFVLDVYLWGLL